jgi:hypothetical protein
MKHHMAVAIGALVVGEALKALPLTGRPRRAARTASAVLSLVSGFALRWAMVHGGHDAANDPHTARMASRPQRRSAAPRRRSMPRRDLRSGQGAVAPPPRG